MYRYYFSLAEANALLPQLEPMLRNLQDMKHEIDTKYQRLLEAKQAIQVSYEPHDVFFAQEAELEFLVFHANALLDQIHATGVEVKDIELGLCDFYSLYQGGEILLCWRLGEPEIRFWHGVQEGFVGRKPIWFE